MPKSSQHLSYPTPRLQNSYFKERKGKQKQLGTMAHVNNLSTREVEAGGWSSLHNKFKTSLENMKPCLMYFDTCFPNTNNNAKRHTSIETCEAISTESGVRIPTPTSIKKKDPEAATQVKSDRLCLQGRCNRLF